MKKCLLFLYLLALPYNFVGQSIELKSFNSVEMDTLISDKISIRALIPDGSKIWYGADQGRIGYFDLKDNTHFQKKILFDSIKPDFRNIATTSDAIFVLNAGSPALVYKISKDATNIKSVYRDFDKAIFYDSMRFWDPSNGLAVGDPIDGQFTILKTSDGGTSWERNSAVQPKAADGEAAFAASNSILVATDKKIIFFSGGKSSRMYSSTDNGKTWEVMKIPIISGTAMTGVFTADFYDEFIGIIAGGDYENPNNNKANKAMTFDGGKTWKLVTDSEAFGYTSCVKFIPQSDGKEIVTVGATGLWYSSDAGDSWKKLSDDTSLYTLTFINRNTAFAAGRNKLVRLRLR